MELTYEETERYINQICSGMQFVDIAGIRFLLKQPTLKDKIKAKFIYDVEYEKAINDGFISNEVMARVIEERGIITEEDRNNIKKLNSELEAQRVILAKTTKVAAKQDRIKNIIKQKEEELELIENKERAQFAMTADTKAEESKILYLCWLSVYDFDSNALYWNDHIDFVKERNYLLRQKVVNVFLRFYNGLSTNIVRYIARSSLWRIKYVTSMKTSDQLFGISTADYSNDMSNLVYWSQYYNNIYEMMPDDRPPDIIIDDDEALDAYMEDYYKERQKEGNTRRGRKTHGRLSAYDKEEVIVTRSDPLYQDFEYDKPREAAAIKNKALVNKRTRRG